MRHTYIHKRTFKYEDGGRPSLHLKQGTHCYFQLESLTFSMSTNIPPLLQFFRTSALVSVLIYEKEHTQKQPPGSLTIAKKHWHEKNVSYTQHIWSEKEKQLWYLNATTHPTMYNLGETPTACQHTRRLSCVFQLFVCYTSDKHISFNFIHHRFLHRPRNGLQYTLAMRVMWHEEYASSLFFNQITVVIV